MERIKRIENGAIDTTYYLEISSRLRGQALRHYFGRCLRSLAGLKVDWQQRCRPHHFGQTTRFHRGNSSDTSQ